MPELLGLKHVLHRLRAHCALMFTLHEGLEGLIDLIRVEQALQFGVLLD